MAERKTFTFDRVNVMLMNVFGILLPLLALFTNALDVFDYEAARGQVLFALPFFVASLWLIWLSHRDLGENWSVTLELKHGHALVTEGIYKYIRHPMYTSIWLYSAGQALAIPNYAGGLGVLLVWAVLYFVRIGREERMLVEKFGGEYSAYMRRTKRLVPFVV